jgi:1-acyl-sn-glycerol-3-phosphate acyltransferase
VTEVDTFLAGNSRASRAFYQFGRAVVVGFTRLVTRPRIIGKEHIPETGAFILSPVHRSNMDSPIAAAVTRRRMRFMGKDTLWKNSSFGWLLSALGGFPVTRHKADREALMRCITVLGTGEPIVVFPEGERKSGPIVQPMYHGAAYMAIKAGVPIVPVGIGGSEKVMTKGSKMIHPHKVVVIIGEPLQPEPTVNNRVPREAVDRMSEELHARLQELFDAAQVQAGP